jgi:hypothetical protein
MVSPRPALGVGWLALWQICYVLIVANGRFDNESSQATLQ